MGFFADGRDEEIEEQEARELDGQFATRSSASRAYVRFTHIFPKCIKYILLALVVLVYGVSLFRIQTSKAPASLRNWIWCENAITQYQANPAAFALFSQAQEEDISESKIQTKDQNGNQTVLSFVFATSHIQFSPTANQFQVTARYNKSMEEPLKKLFNLPALPTGEWFAFALEDQDGNLYPASYVISDQRNVNHFRRLVFCDVPMHETKELSLLVCYAHHIDFSHPLFELNVYRSAMVSEPMEVEFPTA